MAAKPPKPPGHFLKQLNDCLSNNNNNIKNLNKNKREYNLIGDHPAQTNSVNGCSDTDECLNGNNCITPSPNISSTPIPTTTPTTTSVPASKSICNCTNISIMHLFHEMKQEFPTIPDTIVAQCVNENCHQRENCIEQLRNELALNPIPVQSYPGKVLHPSQRQSSVPRTPITPNAIISSTSALKPIRPAPVQPSNSSGQKSNQGNQKAFGLRCPINVEQQKVNSNSISSATNINSNNSYRNTKKSHQNNNYSLEKDVDNNTGECAKTEATNTPKLSDMPKTTNLLTSDSNCDCVSVSETRLTQLAENRENVNPNLIPNQVPLPHTTAELPLPTPIIAPRARPTTLNLPTQTLQQQQQQRQRVNIQLQKHFQQQQQQQQQSQTVLQQAKPLRKAPLPPIPPKPVQFISTGAHSPQFHHSSSNNNNNNNNKNSNQNSNIYNVNNNSGSTQTYQNSFSNDSSLISPASSTGDSEISVNVSLSSPIVAYQPAASTALKSPIRHRSVITVHPEPPYTKDFVGSPTTTGGNQTIGIPGQKSFTSVNLTLRQPNTDASIPASTIDISAGPGLSGNSSGLTYSSTSYDARRGYQKNFHITVTDQGGVFSASHIRPRSCFYPGGEHEQDTSISPNTGNNINPLRTASSEQCVAQQLQRNNTHHQQQQQSIVATNNITNTSITNEMCVPKEVDVLTETLDRQKTRRDKLATALRDNKKRLNQVEQEINVLIEPIEPGETVRLDDEINRLRCDCQAMLNEIDVARRLVPSLPYNNNNNNNHNNNEISTPSTSTPNQAQNMPSTDEEDYTDTDVDDDNEEEPLQHWACNMCTFRNHPQLNICECCDYVRIRPGTIRIVPTAPVDNAASATSTPTNNNNNNNNNNVASSLETDANLTQQQLPQFALHT